ncbi:glucose-1-phosphate cytidylyltransferase, partial [Candidatus Pelagibacter sp.]|nr:glucose-1-phosphate cytidylyltransferase [Candidatus Pelagibacter sp.]
SKKNKTIMFKDFDIKILNTGLDTLTGARVLKYKKFMQNNKYFAVTYGDGLANINLKKVFKKFYKTDFEGIMCASNPNEKFGTLKIKKNMVTNFKEKEKDPKKWINIGFFIFKKIFFKYLDKNTMLEEKPLKKITNKKKLMVYKHMGLYNCMDTLHEKKIIQNMIRKKSTPPWLK